MGNQSVKRKSFSTQSQVTLLIDQNKQRNATLVQLYEEIQTLKHCQFQNDLYIGYLKDGNNDIVSPIKPQNFQKQKRKFNSWLHVKKSSQNKVIIQSSMNKNQNNLVSQILPKNTWFNLQKDDKFKVGRSIFRFIQCGQYNKFKQQKISKTQKIIQRISSKKHISLKESCKICLQNGQTQENPLISPCSCSGSIQNIHLECLNKWLFQQKSIGYEQNIIQIKCKKVICSICKQQFSQKNQYYDKIISSLLQKQNKWSQSKNPKNIAVIEGILENQAQQHKRIFYIIQFQKDQILEFGRYSYFANLKQDTSISRLNTSLKFQNSKIKIRDQNSKNGTGVIVKFPYEQQEKSYLKFVERKINEKCQINTTIR